MLQVKLAFSLISRICTLKVAGKQSVIQVLLVIKYINHFVPLYQKSDFLNSLFPNIAFSHIFFRFKAFDPFISLKNTTSHVPQNPCESLVI